MSGLPKVYMKILRRLTGFWGAYPLSQDLAPGMVGRRVQGVFMRDSDLSDYPGYDQTAFAAAAAEPRSPVDAWVDQGARLVEFGAGVGGGALPAEGKLQLQFSGANQGALVCRRPSEWSFVNLRRVKDHLVDLYQQGHWQRGAILVTSVIKAEEAFAFFSAEAGTSVDLGLAGLPGLGPAAEALKAALGSGSLRLGHNATSSAGYSSALDQPGTPLFQAIKLGRLPTPHASFVVRGEGEFREVSFGDEDDDDEGQEA
jgi:hypothetical protein